MAMFKQNISTKVEDKNLVKLACIYQLMKNKDISKKDIIYLNFKEMIDDDFDINYKLPSDCLLSYNKPQYSGDTVLHFAVEFYNECNNVCFSYLLIQHGIDLTIQNDSGFTPLSLALINKKNKCINEILLYNFTRKDLTNYYCKNGISYFHAACSTNLLELVKCYLSEGVCINESVNKDSPSFAGYTPLHFAMLYCQPQMIEFLLSNGAYLNKKDTNGMTPLHLLVKKLLQRNTLEIDTEMKKFLQNATDSNLFNLPDEVGFSYTHLSCILGTYKFQEVDAKIHTPLDVNSPIYPGYTHLHFATQFNFETVISLLETEADLLVKDVNGTTPFDLCLMKFNLDNVIQILLKDKRHQLSELKFTDGTAVLESLQAMKTQDILKDYLKCKFKNINTFVPFESPIWAGCSLLHLALKLNVSAIPILDYQPNFNMQDANNMSPLHIAFQMNKEDIVSKILSYSNFNFTNSVDQNNLSVLHICCAANNIEAVKHLLHNGANPNLPTLCDFHWNTKKKKNLIIKTGSTPLHIAVHILCLMNYDLVDILLSYEANPRVADANGFTPYHIALQYQRGKVFNQMLKSDTRFDSEKGHEKLGLTKLHIACIIRDLQMIKTILESGVNVNECIKFDSPIWPGDTALHILCRDQFSKKEFVELLLAHGADLNMQNASKSTPVHLRNGELLQFAKDLLRNDFYFKNPFNNEGLSHFHMCCKANSLLVAENFLKSGINVNTPVNFFADNDAGWTGLHFAVKNTNLNFIEMLLRYEADPNIKAADGLSPILLSQSLHVKKRNMDKINKVQELLRRPAINVQASNSRKGNEIPYTYPVDENKLTRKRKSSRLLNKCQVVVTVDR